MADEFGFQTDEELGFIPDTTKENPEPTLLQNAANTVQDATVGLGQGITLGGGDELYGLGKGTYDYLTGPESQSWLENYRNAQKEAEARVKLAEERSPYATTIAELAGGVAPTLITAGASAPLLASKAAAKTALKPYLARQIAAGSGVGALSGILGSEGTLEGSPDELLKDAGISAAVGGALGGVLGGAQRLAAKVPETKAGQYVANKLQDSPTFRQLKIAFRKGKHGDEIGRGDIATQKTALEENKMIQEVKDQLSQTDDVLNKQFGQVLDAETAKGTLIDLAPVEADYLKSVNQALQSNELIRNSPQAQLINESVDKLQQYNQLNPKELFSLKKILRQFENNISVPELQFTVKNAIRSIDGQLEKNVLGFKEVNEALANYRGNVLERLTGVKNWSNLDVKSQSKQLDKSVSQMLRELTSPGHGASGAETKRKFYDILNNLQQVEKNSPGKLESMGIPDLKSFERDIINKADKFAMTRQALGQEPQSSPVTNLIASLGLSDATTGRGMMMGAANKLGMLSKSSTVDAGKNLFKLPGEKLTSIGESLRNAPVPGVSQLGDYLLKGLNNKSQAGINAALFSIMQNPNARNLVYDLIPGLPERSEEDK